MKKYYPFEINDKGKLWHTYNKLFLLYYFKWIKKPKIKKKLLEKSINSFKKYNKKSCIPYSLRKFNTQERYGIIKWLWFFQITFWCSRWCNFCWADAPLFKEPIAIPFFQVKHILKKYNNYLRKNSTFLYWASEPTDYYFKWKDYVDVVKIYKEKIGYFPFTSTWLNRRNLKTFSKIKNIKTRISKLSSDKKIIKENNIDITNYNSNQEILYNGLNWYSKKKYTYGIWCLNWTLITPFWVYNLVNIRLCNDYFPQGLLVFPILKIQKKIFIEEWNNLIYYLDKCIVLYDYNEVRLYNNVPNKWVVFLYDLNKIYMIIYSKSEMNKWIIKILKSIEISNSEYENLVYTSKWQNILFQIENNE